MERTDSHEIILKKEEATALSLELKKALIERPITTKDKQKIQFLINGLGDKNGLIRRSFAESLGLIGEHALPGLIQALRNSSNVTIRRAAAKTLKLVGDPSALPHLHEALMTDKDPVVQGSAAGAMAIFGKTSIKYLLKVLNNPISSEMQCGLASWALEFAGKGCTEILKEAAKSDNFKVRAASISALGSQSEYLEDNETNQILLNSLNDKSPEARAEATRLITKINQPELIRSLLIEKLNDSDSLVRKSAVLSLISLNHHDTLFILKEIALIEKDISVLNIINFGIRKLSDN